MRRWNFAFQKGFAEARGQATRRIGRQDTKQSPPGRHPGKRLLQHADRQATQPKLPHRESGERAVGLEIGTEQDAAGLNPLNAQRILEEARRHVQHGERLAHERQHRRQSHQTFDVRGQRQVTRPSPRGRPQLGQVHRQPLLQLACPTGSHQGRPWWATADVDEEAGAIGLRAGAGKRCGRGPRSACRADGDNNEDPPVHLPAGLA